MQADSYIPGMRVEIRDAEWRIDRVDTPPHGGKLLTCTGHGGLVRGITGRFLTDLEKSPKILSPETTSLEDDLSNGYAATQLYIDSLLQTTPPADDKIHLGHQAAMDLLPYQLDPALQALQQTRPRILIADAVGLGKTIGAGILITELIRRNRGKRILVLAVKSMLAQFQQEMWQRFTIPLVRLDSVGLQRIRNTIPANHNPFHHFDRAIISIDTLKQSLEYRQYLEQCHWDIVVIDEAHNVAQRGSNSQRHRLAQLLCTRCDAMVMLSATPHDGRPESFASLIHMLDPTAIPDPKDYASEDYRDRGLVIRRFKKDVSEQLKTALPEREVFTPAARATLEEENAYSTLRQSTFKTLNKKTGGAGQLFRTTLEKAMLSSTAACISTVENRLNKLQKKYDKKPDEDIAHDIDQLQTIHASVSTVEKKHFSKYQHLLEMLTPKGKGSISWKPKDAEDRLVIFTESVVTLNYLFEHLPKDLKLKATGKAQVAILHGGLKDTEITETVNAFNRSSTPLRLLICSDVASEGLNLHHCSHRLIHFDVPWSLMVFQQRNGRVDRYGQTEKPEIYYLITDFEDSEHGDRRVVEVLVEKDTAASKNLGDPSEFGTQEEQEAATAEAFEAGTSSYDFAALLDKTNATAGSDVSVFENKRRPTSHTDKPEVIAPPTGVYSNTREFMVAGLEWLKSTGSTLKYNVDSDLIDIQQSPADLQSRAKKLPREAIPEDYRFVLSDTIARVMEDMQQARDDESGSFGKIQYLWSHHPTVEWMRQRVVDSFGRHTAPVVRLPDKLAEDEHWFLAQGGFPNRRGQALIQNHAAIKIVADNIADLLPLKDCLELLGIDGSSLPNRAESQDCEALTLYLPDVTEYLRSHLKREKSGLEKELKQKVQAELQHLDELREKHLKQLELEFESNQQAENIKNRRKKDKQNQIERHFQDYQSWISDAATTEDEPYIQIVAVITGSSGELL